MRKREFFYSEQQWKRYCLAYKYGIKLKEYQDKGYLIIDENNKIINGSFEVPDDNDWSAVTINSKKCRISLVDFEWWTEGKMSGKPWITSLKKIKETFKDYKIINPKDIKKIKF